MMSPRPVIFGSLLLAFVGCSSGFHAHESISSRHNSSEITLSREQPRDQDLGIKLRSIAADGTTTIRRLGSRQMLRASPGGYFASQEFGAHGLELVRASSESQVAILRHVWAD
jgi:hypothetical protein